MPLCMEKRTMAKICDAKKKCFWGFCQVLCTQTHPAAWNCSFCNIMWSTEKHIVPVLCTYLAREQFVKQLGNCVSKIAHRIKQQWASSQQIRCINCSNQCKDSQSLRLLVKDAGYKTARWAGRTKPSTQHTRRDHFFCGLTSGKEESKQVTLMQTNNLSPSH